MSTLERKFASEWRLCYRNVVLNPSLQASQDATRTKRRPSLQARKHQLVRDAIWDAAIDLFAQKGFDETTVDDIVEAAGVSRRSFFRYFASKDDLITQRGTVSYEKLLTEAVQSCPPSYPLPEILKHTVFQVARRSAAEPRTRKIMEIAAKHAGARDALSRVSQAHQSVAAAFGPHCGKGAKGRVTANLLAALTLSLLSATFHAWFENGEQDISKTVDQMFTMLNRLICDTSNRSEHANSDEKLKRSRH